MFIVQHLEVEPMKKLVAILALAVLLVPGIVLAQPAGCSWNGDPCVRYGWNGVQGPGINTANILPGQTLEYEIGLQNGNALWNNYLGNGITGTCNNANGVLDTFCTHLVSLQGWEVVSEDLDTPWELASGYLMWWPLTIKATGDCDAVVGSKDTVIISMSYAKGEPAETCAPECGDCLDPTLRFPGAYKLYHADTLILTVVAPSNPISIVQDTLTLIDQGATQAYIPFTVGNAWACFTGFGYNIKSKGHVGGAINTSGTLTIGGGAERIVYGIVDASSTSVCTYDTLTIIVWSLAGPTIWYDTCVQRVHVVTPVPVPLFTVPVVTILVLALILAAAVFMRRRAVSRA
jgi:hypothetical protein